jgi:arylsulfatase A-like enzyme
MYEESIHVPLIIYDPRLPVAARGRRTQMALNIDLAPTVLAMAGVPIPAAMQGENLQPVLSDPNAGGREDWFYEHVYSPRDGRRGIPKIEGVRSERWKYTRYTESDPPLEQLFDLTTDPHEETDLVRNPEHRELLARLRTRCDHYRQTLK